MAKGVKHYFKNGKEHKGATHKDAKGRVMSGKTHTASSNFLVGDTAWGYPLHMNGDIGSVKIYNRALTAQEIRSNFNAVKSRFGI